MTLLALDTSGFEGSVAVSGPGADTAVVRLEQRGEHAARLVPAIEEALAVAGVATTDLEGVVVGAGPGSFTGVRVAAATAKGLVHALGVPLWAVSSLAGTAIAYGEHRARYVLVDARADRVYGACYLVQRDALRVLVQPHAGILADVLGPGTPSDALFVGDGALRHEAAIEKGGFRVDRSEPRTTVAEGLLGYLTRLPGATPVVDPGAWEPTYLRASSAVPS